MGPSQLIHRVRRDRCSGMLTVESLIRDSSTGFATRYGAYSRISEEYLMAMIDSRRRLIRAEPKRPDPRDRVHVRVASRRRCTPRTDRSSRARFDDPMLARTAVLGEAHEARHLATLKASGRDVVEFTRPDPYTPESLAEAYARTIEALQGGADVVYQGALFDGTFGGLADFLVRGENGLYEVWDTKLTRHAKVEALLQIAAYADLLDVAGIARSPTGFLLLGDNQEFSQRPRRDHPRVPTSPSDAGDSARGTSRGRPRGCVERSPIRHLRDVRTLPGRDRGQRRSAEGRESPAHSAGEAASRWHIHRRRTRCVDR